ncbi:F-box domain containing protein, partial [Tanacetum coccineum]
QTLEGRPQTETYDVEAIRQTRPEEITADEWDKYIQFWNNPKNLSRAAQNRQNRQKSMVISRQGSRSLACLQDEMASDTQEYPSLIDTFWRTHTVDGVFPKDEDRRIYEEMKRLEATGEYTEDEINRLARGGKLRGHIPGVGRVLPSRATSRPSMPAPDKSLKSIHKKVDFMMSLFRSDSKYSDMFKEFESGGASGSGGCGDDEESGDDEDGDGERIPYEASPANIPQRLVAGENFPQRLVAREMLKCSPGKKAIVVVRICMKNDDHACEKEGAVIGKLAFTYDEDRIDCMEVGIEVEKDVVFRSLAKDNFYAQKKGCIILKAGKGLSDLATRLFVRQLLMRRKLLPMTKEDLKAGRDLLKEDFMKKNVAWAEELNWKEKAMQKVELQAFGTFHFNYLTKFYLPRKLKEIDD